MCSNYHKEPFFEAWILKHFLFHKVVRFSIKKFFQNGGSKYLTVVLALFLDLLRIKKLSFVGEKEGRKNPQTSTN